MPYSQANRAAAAAYVAELRAATTCERCGAQPVEWHHDEHAEAGCSWMRVSALAMQGFPIARIQAEVDRCEALCRSCHMRIDGRTATLAANRPRQKGMRLPPNRCTECGELAKPLRRGLCNRCSCRARRRVAA